MRLPEAAGQGSLKVIDDADAPDDEEGTGHRSYAVLLGSRRLDLDQGCGCRPIPIPKRSGYLIGVPFHVDPELVLVRLGLGFGKRSLAETFESRLAIDGTGEVFADASLHCQLVFWLVGLLGQQAQRFHELLKPIIHRVPQRSLRPQAVELGPPVPSFKMLAGELLERVKQRVAPSLIWFVGLYEPTDMGRVLVESLFSRSDHPAAILGCSFV